MATVKLELATDETVEIEHGRFKSTVSLWADNEEVLNHFSVADIVAHFDCAELLDEIGQAAVFDHFDVEE